MISEQYYHVHIISEREISKKLGVLISHYLYQVKLHLAKSSIQVEFNGSIFIKIDSILTKLFIFLINYFIFQEKNIFL